MNKSNYITTSIKAKANITKKQWLSWKKETLRELKFPSEKNQAVDKSANNKSSGFQSRISEIKVILEQIQSAHLHIKTKKRNSLIKINIDEVKKSANEVIKELGKQYINIAKEKGKDSDWNSALKFSTNAVKSVASVTNKIVDVKLDLETILFHVRALYMTSGNSPELRKFLQQAIVLYPKSPELSIIYSYYLLLSGNYSDALKAISWIPANVKLSKKLEELLKNIRHILLPTDGDNRSLSNDYNHYTYQHLYFSEEKLIDLNQWSTSLDKTFTFKDSYEDVHEFWFRAIKEMRKGNYNSCINYLQMSLTVCLRYLINSPRFSLDINERELRTIPETWVELKANFRQWFSIAMRPKNISHIQERIGLLTFDELYKLDWISPKAPFEIGNKTYDVYNNINKGPDNFFDFIKTEYFNFSNPDIETELRRMDIPIILLGLIYIPICYSEACYQSKQFQNSIDEINDLINANKSFRALNDFVEIPFLIVLKAKAYLELGNRQFKAGETSLDQNGQPTTTLKAITTYQSVIGTLNELGSYEDMINQGIARYNVEVGRFSFRTISTIFIKEANRLNLPVNNPLSNQEKLEFNSVAKRNYLSAFDTNTPNRLALVPSKNYPLQRVLSLSNINIPIQENDPLVYSIILEARSRIEQINAGLNFLGYTESYVPPWKFSYLIDRARYYTDQAKSLQRDYLNFISNAEREEFQEMNAAQSVVMERMNLVTEEARVDQAQAELEVARVSKELADLQAANANDRIDNYNDYDEAADNADEVIKNVNLMGGIGATLGGLMPPNPNAIIGSATNMVITAQQTIKESAGRDLEKTNLVLAKLEADKTALVAEKQVAVANATFLVANLQAQSALMRLQFAQDNLEYLANRLTSAELWFRLAHAIRGIANTYLRRAIEMSFLAEQVYEFMVDKRLNIIRFDYDDDALGDMLGADFLKADLDYLESHLIFTQKEKQQQVKCVISLARDFPQALLDLGQNESVILPITLKYLETRFPGLFNIKVAAIELQPVAIMDPTRFSVELTYLGSGTIRTKAYPINTNGDVQINNNNASIIQGINPGDPPQIDLHALNQNWLPGAEIQFPVNTLLRPVETAIISGLTAGEESAFFQSFSSQQKNAFEDCPASAGWRIDMSMIENKVVQGSLVDMVITLYVTGYYDSDLKNYIESALNSTTNVVSSVMSARNQFSDQFFSFQNDGKIDFNITPDLITTNERIGALVNIGSYFNPSVDDILINRYRTAYATQFTIDAAGNLKESFPQPQFVFAKNNNSNTKIDITVNNVVGKNLVVLIEGDEANPVINKSGNTFASNAETGTYQFNKQGRHVLITRVSDASTRNEYRSEIYISETGEPVYPDTVYPTFIYDRATNVLALTINNDMNLNDDVRNVTVTIMDKQGNIFNVEDAIAGDFVQSFKADRINSGNLNYNTNPLTALIDGPNPENLILIATFTKPLTVSASARQRNTLTAFQCEFNKLTTNRQNRNGDALNQFAQFIFPDQQFISPLDEWHFEIEPDRNNFIQTYDCNGTSKIDLSIFQDVILFMEYELKRR